MMIAVVSCASDFNGLNRIFSRAGDESMKKLLLLIGYNLSDSRTLFQDILDDNKISEDFGVCVDYV